MIQIINMEYKYKLLGKNVASSKNSKIKTRHGLINSKVAQEYYKWVEEAIQPIKEELCNEIKEIGYPIKFHFFYHRDSERHFDYANVVQILADFFQKEGILEDDDADHFIPVFDGYDIVPEDKIQKINPNGKKVYLKKRRVSESGVEFFLEKALLYQR